MRTALVIFFCLFAFVAAPVAQDKQSPVLIKAELPLYPPLARQAHIQGNVKISFEVTEDGTVSNVQATSGHAMLKPGAIENVRSWKFRNGGGKQHVETEFVFRLENGVQDNPRLTVSLESFRRIEVRSDFVLIADQAIVQ